MKNVRGHIYQLGMPLRCMHFIDEMSSAESYTLTAGDHGGEEMEGWHCAVITFIAAKWDHIMQALRNRAVPQYLLRISSETQSPDWVNSISFTDDLVTECLAKLEMITNDSVDSLAKTDHGRTQDEGAASQRLKRYGECERESGRPAGH